jgi:hypothetical protein
MSVQRVVKAGSELGERAVGPLGVISPQYDLRDTGP